MNPIDGQALLLAAAKASVGPADLPDLIEAVQDDVADRLPAYRQRYELVYEDDTLCVFFVESDHWESVAERVGLGRRERDAIARAHAEHLRRLGSHENRREEFETALDIRECVVVGKKDDGE